MGEAARGLHYSLAVLFLLTILTLPTVAPVTFLFAESEGNDEPEIGDLQVYLGYANSSPRYPKPPTFPDPWEDSSNVIFKGNGVGATLDYDSGAIRIDNPTSSDITISSVTVDLPGTECNPDPYGCRPFHFDIWPHDIVVPANYTLILTQNSPQYSNMSNFDTSDRNFTNCDPFFWSPDDIHSPIITIETPSDLQVIVDTGHVLDRGGMDVAHCIGNESAPWTLVWPMKDDEDEEPD